MKHVFSLVIPVFNEEETINELYARLSQLAEKIDGDVEFVFIDDGSSDRSLPMLEALHGKDERVKIIAFSRNFGHQFAITAGMDLASGDAVIVMDADLQDPPETVLDLIAKWKEGYQVVNARRRSRKGESWFKRSTAKAFYRILSFLTPFNIPLDTGDFRLVDRSALDAFLYLREEDRFVRGMFAWNGFRQTEVAFDRNERFAGQTKYPLHKMLKLAAAAVFSFSDWPLRAIVQIGSLVSLFAFVYAIYIVIRAIFSGYEISGWASTATLILFLSGIQLMVTGVVGLYVGRIHLESKRRPIYVASRAVGFGTRKQPDRAIIASWE
ncbi:glycosyltransferase family 2 protein [Microbaculum sp. FT89]|uniref:glycosyltransferase family 2 protein n=1 Tax=Microbaculum sp. FT89 TaxID=3447298 RepID=UPI003F52B24E